MDVKYPFVADIQTKTTTFDCSGMILKYGTLTEQEKRHYRIGLFLNDYKPGYLVRVFKYRDLELSSQYQFFYDYEVISFTNINHSKSAEILYGESSCKTS